MLGWFKRKSNQRESSDERQVLVFLNPLVMLLAGRERQKGSPLTKEEVLAVRDSAQCIMMSKSQAEKFYASLDGQVSVPRINPDRCWEEWQELRKHLEY